MTDDAPPIDESLVAGLIARQFPEWSALPVRAITPGGWDHRSFRCGDEFVVRLPSAECYSGQIEKEHRWLGTLAPRLPLPIPTPVAMGEPDLGYPWRWAILKWIDGEIAARESIDGRERFARELAGFLRALRAVGAENGPSAGAHNFFRGGPLSTYDGEVREAIAGLSHRIDGPSASEVWESALASTWHGPPVWVHGDVAASNLLVRDGRLAAVIDFGSCAVGDPACDLVIAWTLLRASERAAFRDEVELDRDTWRRARGWALWKALILMHRAEGPASSVREARRVFGEVMADPVGE